MKNGKLFFTLTVSLAFLLVFAVPARSAERSIVPVPVKDKSGNKVLLYKESHALLIGVSAYTGGWPELRGVQEDVRSVKKVLENNGFHVVVVENPTRERMEKAFNDFIIQYGQGENDRVLVYYAGHGHTLKLLGGEMGYIVPADAPNPNRDRKGFLAKAVDMQMMEVYAKRIQAKHALFLFDSCFSGSLFDVGRAIPENIGHKTSKPIRQFITAGSADETVPDHSVFREQFVAALEGEADMDRDGYVTGAELGEFLHKTVVNYSRSAQHPQYGKIRDPRLDKGDFVFPLRTASLTPDAGQSDLLQERQKLEAERAQLEAERKKLTEEKQLAEERKKLEEEKRRLEEEKKRMEVASLPRGNLVEGQMAYDRKDYATALRNFKPLAEQGNVDAQVLLGIMYEYGEGMPQNHTQAVVWFRKAADQGDAQARFKLGFAYERGLGAPQDYAQAVAWYRMAAEQGYANAQGNLGVMYRDGRSMPQDHAQAMAWFRKAAEQGHANGQVNLGYMYEKGLGVPVDYAQAMAWYRKSAEQGDAVAQDKLGYMYAAGLGTPRNDAQAVAWYRKSAEQGNADGQASLGYMYEDGRGVPRDLTQAMAWYRKAAEQGNSYALEALRILGGR